MLLLLSAAAGIAIMSGIQRLSAELPPLHLAIRDHDHTRLAALLEAGAPANTTYAPLPIPPFTPLMLAARTGDLRSIQILLDAGADIEAQDRNGRTALFYAMEAPTAEAFEFLRSRGADCTARDRHRTTLLHAAASGAQATVIPTLAGLGLDPNVLDEYDNTPLASAVLGADHATVEALLAAGASPNGAGPGGDTAALHWAAQFNDDTTVRALLKAGADPNGRSVGVSPLFHAVLLLHWQNPRARPRASFEVIEALLEGGADPDPTHPNGQTLDAWRSRSPGPGLDPPSPEDQARVSSLLLYYRVNVRR